MSTPSYVCPHCGADRPAADDSSGGPGVCGVCGQDIPPASGPVEPASKRRAKRSWLLVGIIAFVALGGLELIGGGVFLLGLAVYRAWGPAGEQADLETAQEQLEAFMAGLDAYRLAVGDFPSTSQGLEALRTPPADLAGPHKWAGPYLAEPIPRDPWKRPYEYRYPGKHSDRLPDVWSSGPDGKAGTEDDVASWQRRNAE